MLSGASHDELTCKAALLSLCPSELTPHRTDQWIPANSVRRFVLKYQCPAGDSSHSSVCLCCRFLPPSILFSLTVFVFQAGGRGALVGLGIWPAS